MIVKLIAMWVDVACAIFELIVPLNPPPCMSKCWSFKPRGKAFEIHPWFLLPSLPKNPKSIVPLTRMTIFFLHCMFRCFLFSQREACSQEAGTSRICLIISCPSAPLVESFACSECSLSKCSLDEAMDNECMSSLKDCPCLTRQPMVGWRWTLTNTAHSAFLVDFQHSCIAHTHPLRDTEKSVPPWRWSSLPPRQHAQEPLTFNSSSICLFSPELKIPTNVTRLRFPILTCDSDGPGTSNTNEHLRSPWISRGCRALRR